MIIIKLLKYLASFFLLITILGTSLYSQTFKVLVFSKTEGFRHSSIPNGIIAIERLGQQHDFTVDATEDASAFTFENLQQYEAIIFLSTTGDVLNRNQQDTFERYIRNGGGFVGIHAASDTEYNWSWYGELVGAYFESHPAIQTATIEVTDRIHPQLCTCQNTGSEQMNGITTIKILVAKYMFLLLLTRAVILAEIWAMITP